ncbi:MAG: NADH-quinone oxidoreductase subunit J [Thermodesulfobacteriota bacterium]
MEISLETARFLAEIIFYGLIGVTIFGGLLATCAKRLMRAVSGLAVCFLGIAGIYYFLGSPFVAMMQLLIYVGAVSITLVFAVMMGEPDENTLRTKVPGLAGPFSVVLGGAVAAGLASLALKANWMEPMAKVNDGSLPAVGAALLTKYSMVFELVSIVLLIAILGSVIIAGSGRDKVTS